MTMAHNEVTQNHSHGRFVAALEHEIERCRLFGREAAMVMVRDCGPNSQSLLERGRLLKRWLRPVDQLAFYSDRIVEVLLPELGWPEAEELARGWCEGQVLGSDTVLAAGLAVFPESGRSSREILDRCRQVLRDVSPEQPLAVVSSSRPAEQQSEAPPVFRGLLSSFPESGLDLRDHLRRYEAELIRAAMRAAGWRQIEAARLLRLPLRTLARKVKDHAIRRPD
jgi:hypothetical protein